MLAMEFDPPPASQADAELVVHGVVIQETV
jgi:hypothetical protein